MRTVKRANERREEIVVAAQRLFVCRGFDVVTVSDILEEVGLSKGAFYHHFTSKDDVLVGVAEAMAKQSIARLLPILEAPSLTPIQKLNGVFAESSRFNEENAFALREMLTVLFRDENFRLRMRLAKHCTEQAAPYLTAVLVEGQRSGDFDIEDPPEVARIVMQLGYVEQETLIEALQWAQEKDPREAMNALTKRMIAYERSMERLVGAPTNSLRVFDRAFLERFFLLSSSSPVRPRNARTKADPAKVSV